MNSHVAAAIAAERSCDIREEARLRLGPEQPRRTLRELLRLRQS